MRLVSAGMPEPLLLRGNQCQVLQVAGISLGLFPEVDFKPLTIQLQPGDSLLFYSDAITDARNSLDGEFDAKGLQKVPSPPAGESRLELLVHLISAIEGFSGVCPSGPI